MAIFVKMSLLEIQQSLHLPDAVKQVDYNLFFKMNGQWHTSFFDVFLPFIREPFVWLPLYFFLVVFSIINFKVKGFYWVLFFILNVMLSDYVSSTLIKETFFRLRPC